ncbi:hypothetical protein HPB52_019145 [Rhipicephalus sanguineus]|uniref:Ig-like domain-containing protein n=1 Tax=Rhipicephalus sanguineus TaxID=34632 RepID=A0A9D4T7W1_RHISA|nr:hypothetical protein HPB52_019145 [Rhipicephalus sanguineus]
MAWHKDGDVVRDTDRITVVTKASSVVLSIEAVGVADIGNYTCTAANEFGVDALTMPLVVTGPRSSVALASPANSPSVRRCRHVRGEERNYGTLLLSWNKGGHEIENTDRITVAIKATSAMLTSIPFKWETLATTRPPRVFEFNFPPEVALGDEIIVGCAVKKGTSGPYRIAWQKDSKDVEKDGRLSVFGESKTSAALRITGVRPEDVGNYTCVAKNSFGSDSFTAQLVIHVPPKLQSTGFPSEISVGDDTAAVCLVTKGSPGPFTIAWHKDGEEVRNSHRIAVSVKASSAVLNIQEISVEDVGNYSCTATNRFGTGSLTLTLLVTAPPKVGELSFPSDVALGDEVIVTCVVKKGSQGPYQITWQKDAKEVTKDAGGRVSVSTPSKSSATLRIASLRAEDVGNYTCTAKNRFGSDSVTASLVVHATPKLQSAGFPSDLSLGDDTIATCVVKKGSPGPFKMAWRKDGDELKDTDRVSVVSHVNSIALRVEAPKLGRFDFPADVALGDEIVETCVVKKGSVGPYRIALLKDGKLIEGSDRVSVSSASKSSVLLRIGSLKPEDVGNYTCTASNQYGSDSVTATLVVNGNNPSASQH